MSIRTRLTLGFFIIGSAAIGVVFGYVIPTLESRLRDEKLDAVVRTAQEFAGELGPTFTNVDERRVRAIVADVAQRANTRVTLLNVATRRQGGELSLETIPVADSLGDVRDLDLDFPVADRAAQTGRLERATESGQGGSMAEAAQRIERGRQRRVVVFAVPLSDVADTVSLIRRQVFVAGGLAVLFAALAGLLVARALSMRIKRLEDTARRVARGDFSARFPIDRDDELGRLAMALDDMQRQLAQLDSARKRFIATASHELRTPIFSLGGFVELLQDEDLDDLEREAFLTQMRDQVARLQNLATELLDLSRLEAGSLELRPEPTDLGVLAEAVTAEFIPALTHHGAHLELRLPRGGIEAVCDPERVAQVLRILIDNALTHTPEGTNVVVSASRENGRATLAVRDFGPGIKRAAIDRIFEPFFTSDDAQGSGLGLAIAHELAERMEGRLAVDSQPGRTTFSFELPV
jgi:two-component system, OmpR family, sensor kinase